MVIALASPSVASSLDEVWTRSSGSVRSVGSVRRSCLPKPISGCGDRTLTCIPSVRWRSNGAGICALIETYAAATIVGTGDLRGGPADCRRRH